MFSGSGRRFSFAIMSSSAVQLTNPPVQLYRKIFPRQWSGHSMWPAVAFICYQGYKWMSRSGRINCCWSSPAQSLLVPGPVGLMTIFFCIPTLEFAQLGSEWMECYLLFIYTSSWHFTFVIRLEFILRTSVHCLVLLLFMDINMWNTFKRISLKVI
jgi:hypothetical protein